MRYLVMVTGPNFDFAFDVETLEEAEKLHRDYAESASDIIIKEYKDVTRQVSDKVIAELNALRS